MTWSYDPDEDTALDQIRGKIGDTVDEGHKLEDETITAIYARYPSVLAASAECVRRMIARGAHKFDRSAIGLSSSAGSLSGNLRELLRDIEEQLRSSSGGLFVGGVSESANTTREADTDFVKPAFSVGQHDNTGASDE